MRTKLDDADLASGAVHFDNRSLRKPPRGAVGVDNARNAEFSCYHSRVRHRTTEIGHYSSGICEGGRVPDVGDLRDDNYT